MKKVAVVNRTNLKNYGSVLQAYALCEAIRNLGYESEIIWEEGTLSKNYDFRPNKVISTGIKLLLHPKLIKSTFSSVQYVQKHVISEKTVQLFDDFVKTQVKRKFYPASFMNKRGVGKIYDKFVCGSDQVWCTTTVYVDPLMYLRFAPQEKRIAYGPSLGRDYIPDYNKKKMRRYINSIPDVSVREYIGQKLIEELTGRNVPVVLDPTLLVEKSMWDTVKAEQREERNYVLCYFLSTPTEETQLKLLRYLNQAGKLVIALNSRLEYVEQSVRVIYPDCGPREFISYVDCADCVITDSYHGMLFSIIFHKEFWSVEREYGDYDQSSRQLSVLQLLNLNRYCRAGDEFNREPIDYAAVDKMLEVEREKSVAYLRKALGR